MSINKFVVVNILGRVQNEFTFDKVGYLSILIQKIHFILYIIRLWWFSFFLFFFSLWNECFLFEVGRFVISSKMGWSLSQMLFVMSIYIYIYIFRLLHLEIEFHILQYIQLYLFFFLFFKTFIIFNHYSLNILYVYLIIIVLHAFVFY